MVVLLSAVWFGTCNWRFEVKVKVCFGERVLKVKMWRKVEIPKKNPFGLTKLDMLIYGPLLYSTWRLEGCQRASQRFRGRKVATPTRLSWSMKHLSVARW